PGPTSRQSLLKPVEMGAEGFRLEVVTIRCPLGDPQLNEAAWSQIDEQIVPADVRRRMAENGLRAGVVASQLPLEISQVLTEAEHPTTFTEASAQFAEMPVVSRQQMQ